MPSRTYSSIFFVVAGLDSVACAEASRTQAPSRSSHKRARADTFLSGSCTPSVAVHSLGSAWDTNASRWPTGLIGPVRWRSEEDEAHAGATLSNNGSEKARY